MTPQMVHQVFTFAGFSGASRRPVFMGEASRTGNLHKPVELLPVRRSPICGIEEPGRDDAVENIRRLAIKPPLLQL